MIYPIDILYVSIIAAGMYAVSERVSGILNMRFVSGAVIVRRKTQIRAPSHGR